MLQGSYCLLANKLADIQPNPHNKPKAYELLKANTIPVLFSEQEKPENVLDSLMTV